MIKDETGIALPLVIFVVLALSLLGIILFNYNMAETTQVARDEHRLKAHYLARSGAHALASYLVQNQDLARELRDYMYKGDSHYLESFSKEVELGGGRYQVKAEYLGENAEGEGEIYITSIGRYGNARQSIGLTIKIQGISAAVICSSVSGNLVPGFSIENGDFLYIGDEELEQSVIDTLNNDILEEGHEVRFGSHVFDEVVLPWEDIKLKNMFYGDNPRDWPFAQNDDENADHYYDEDDELRITGNERIRYDIEVDNHGKRYMESSGGITIEAGGEDNHILLYAENIEMNRVPITVRIANNNVVVIVVDDELALDGHGNNPALVLEALDGCQEGGHLLIYLKTFELGGNTPVVVNDPQVHLNMYVYSEGTVDLSGTPSFKGSIYAPHSDYIIAGNTTIEGWIIARDIDFKGASGMSPNKPSDIVFRDVEMLETSMDLETVNMDTWHNTE